MKNGVTVSDHDLDQLLSDDEHFQIQMQPDYPVNYASIADKEIGDNIRSSVRAFLLVNASFGQAASMIKVSRPLLSNRMAKELQEIKLQTVDFSAKDYADKVPVATPEQIQAQFDKYGDNLAGVSDPKTNPFGFGYKYPDRVKLAYIALSRDEVIKSIHDAKSKYDWDVEAQAYYQSNPAEFANTPTSAPATQASAATQPTTKPFDQVRDSIVDAIIKPEAQKLQQEIVTKIESQMREDWAAYHIALSKTPPTTAPASSVGVAFDSPDYLSKVAAQIQQQYKVVPTVVSLQEKFLSQEELKDLPGIGKSIVIFGQKDFTPFGVYATSMAEPFVKGTPQPGAGTIKLFEPSRLMDDYEGSQYIYRLTAAYPSHKPADSREALQQIEQDLRTAGSYDLARADAAKVLEDSHHTSLRAAAVSAHKSVAESPWLNTEEPFPTDLNITEASQKDFLDQAFNLLTAAANKESTIELIGLPHDGKVFVAQLADVRRVPLFADQDLQPAIISEVTGDLEKNLREQWFSYDSIVQRMKYVDAKGHKDEG